MSLAIGRYFLPACITKFRQRVPANIKEFPFTTPACLQEIYACQFETLIPFHEKGDTTICEILRSVLGLWCVFATKTPSAKYKILILPGFSQPGMQLLRDFQSKKTFSVLGPRCEKDLPSKPIFVLSKSSAKCYTTSHGDSSSR
jgi:hypothetical protein